MATSGGPGSSRVGGVPAVRAVPIGRGEGKRSPRSGPRWGSGAPSATVISTPPRSQPAARSACGGGAGHAVTNGRPRWFPEPPAVVGGDARPAHAASASFGERLPRTPPARRQLGQAAQRTRGLYGDGHVRVEPHVLVGVSSRARLAGTRRRPGVGRRMPHARRSLHRPAH